MVEPEVAQLVELQIPKRDRQELVQVAEEEEERRNHREEAVRKGQEEELVHTDPAEAVRTVEVVHRVLLVEAVRRHLEEVVLHKADHRGLVARRGSIAVPMAPRHRRWGRLPDPVVHQAMVEEAVALQEPLREAAEHPKDPHTAVAAEGVVAVEEAALAALLRMDWQQQHPVEEQREEAVDPVEAEELQKDYHLEQDRLAKEFQEEEERQRNHRDFGRRVEAELHRDWLEAVAVAVELHRD